MADELPAEFHCIAVPGLGFAFYVDADARLEVEWWMKDGSEEATPTLDIVTMAGEEITLVRGFVACLYSSTAESRRIDRALGKLLDAEKPIVDL